MEREIESTELSQLEREESTHKNVQKQKRNARVHSLRLLREAPKWGLIDSPEYKAVKNALEAFQEVLDQQPSQENVFEFQDAHEGLGYACRNYIFQKGEAKTKWGQNRLKLVDAVLKLQEMEAYSVNHLRSKEHYMKAVKVGQGGTWEDYLGNIRKRRACVKESEITYHGQSMNQRMEIRLGEETVFFTKERVTEEVNDYVMKFAHEIQDREFKKAFIKEQKDLKKESYLNREFIMQFRSRARDYLGSASKEHDESKVLKEAFNRTLEKCEHTLSEEFVESVRSKENVKIFFQFAKGYQQCCLEKLSLDSINLEMGTNLLSRNVATRRMAELLGISELVVKAEPMELTVDEKVFQGICMSKAEGIDINAPGGQERLARTVNDRNASLQKAMSGLQILDAICGQVDRHSGNIIYKVREQDGEEYVAGVQGIDNELCFGREGLIYTNQRYFIDEKSKRGFGTKRGSAYSVPAIDRDLAENVMALNKSVLRYTLGDILDEQEIHFLNERVKDVKEIVNRRYMSQKVFGNDSQWTEEIARKAEGYGDKNYLGIFSDYHGFISEKLEVKGNLESSDRSKFPESQNASPAEGRSSLRRRSSI